MNDVKLRDKRKPGHCWQDNELYDAFGPVIGPNAILVYVQMTRNCYGTEIRSSSRELARDSGLSKDTVLRGMRVMERVGMLRAVAGGPGKVAEYHLTDLKELAEHHGGLYDMRRASYVFSAQQTARLKAMATGAVRDSSAALTVAVGDSAAPQLALQKPTTVSPEAHPYTRQQDIQENPPTPQRGASDPVCEAGANDPELAAKIAALKIQRDAAESGSAAWWEASCSLRRALLVARPAAPPTPQVQTVHDPPGRRRRWTAAMAGM